MSQTTHSPLHSKPIVPAPEMLQPGRAVVDGALMPADHLDTVQSEQLEQAGAGKIASELQPRTRVAQYELIRELGRGAMGTIFLARDTKLGRLVAMKFLSGYRETAAERFIAEARMTAQCNHENIVVVHDVDKFQDQPYMVLEYLQGKSLRRYVQDRRIPVSHALEIVIAVVRALKRAHEFNIVHRDLKPDNIIVTDSGAIKVLDFGIAKPLSELDGSASTTSGKRSAAPVPDHVHEQLLDRVRGDHGGEALWHSLTVREGKIVGTMPYMSPEQWGVDTIDCRTDLWSIGVILFELLAGKHPLHPLSRRSLEQVADFAVPMPRLRSVVADAPAELAEIVDRCLRKRKDERFASAADLLAALESLLPGRFGARLDEDASPYAGLAAFQEADADRFFGRERDIARILVRVREHALVGVVGPSGVGKSSFLRAGLIPALKRSGERWEVLVTRPGRQPLAGLASLLAPMGGPDSAAPEGNDAGNDAGADSHERMIERLRTEPGHLGQIMRSWARARDCKILLFVDQFEELYTLVPDSATQRAYVACLTGMADHSSSPLRVAVSMRSDFLDRAAEDRDFIEDLTRGLIFLAPPDRDGLRAALTAPAEMMGYRFDPPGLADDILDSLDATSGALPLLQFAATKLWEARDRKHRRLSAESYAAVGGIAGALASHADAVLAGLGPQAQRLVRAIFLRLVTPERTRALVDMSELLQIDADAHEMQILVDHLVSARLLVAQTGLSGHEPGSDDATVELVHESLIDNWPTLSRWLEQHHDEVAFMAQLRGAAAQWHSRGKPQGLLWRGEAAAEARRFRKRFKGELARKEREYLDAVLGLAERARRVKSVAIAATMVFLVALVAAAAVALVWIRDAEQQAVHEAERARQSQRVAEDRLAEILATREQRDQARRKASDATAVAEEKSAEAAQSRAELVDSNRRLAQALREAEAARERAESESVRARGSEQAAVTARRELERALHNLGVVNERLQDQLEKERARNQRKAKELDGIADETLK